MVRAVPWHHCFRGLLLCVHRVSIGFGAEAPVAVMSMTDIRVRGSETLEKLQFFAKRVNP